MAFQTIIPKNTLIKRSDLKAVVFLKETEWTANQKRQQSPLPLPSILIIRLLACQQIQTWIPFATILVAGESSTFVWNSYGHSRL